MQHRTPSCHLTHPHADDSSPISPQAPHPTNIAFEHACDYSDPSGRGGQHRVIAAAQWLNATTGRLTGDPHSWMTAVHWMTTHAARGHYTPSQKHSPKWGPTTVAIAQELAALKECRPGIAYLMRKLKVSERTVQYHLTMLRETGLLAYITKGTRTRGGPNEATVYARTIPAVFDQALGIRTVDEGVQRRPVGAAPEARTLLGKLAKKAARKVRRPRRRTPLSGRRLCTPMEGGTSASSSAANSYSPPESKLASGNEESPTQKQPNRRSQKPKSKKTLNRVGRRYQLARQLIQTIPWLQKASVPRIAWIIRYVADAGWTITEIQAAAERMVVDRETRRPSAVLAYRLASCHLLYTTPGRRKILVDDWRDSCLAEQARHSEVHDDFAATGPRTVAARRAMGEAFAAIRKRLAPPAPTAADCQDIQAGTDGSLEDLDRELVAACRAEALADPSVITGAINAGLPEADARRLYSHRLVDQALALERINAHHHDLAPAF